MRICCANSYTLGIDLGVNSLGTALADPEGGRLVWTGVRIFTPGFEGDYESGKEESRAANRRLKRQQRRQTDRRRRRLLNVFRTLQTYGFLPPGDRETVLPELDGVLLGRYPQTQILPYFLRARALDEPLDAYEVGRALYHLAQRRGFRGRTAREADDEEGGKIKEEMEGLWREIRDSGSRTLGEYLSRLDPHDTRIRARRTHRRMYEEEFDAIWAKQKAYHGEALTEDRRQVIRRAIFYQRPLKPVDHLIGECDLEPGQKRAPLWTLEAQRFRVLNAVNNLKLVEADGTVRALNERQREALLDETRKAEKLTFPKVKKLLGLAPSVRFPIEEGGETSLPGNVTSARIFRILGNDWLEMPLDRQQELVADLADEKRNQTDEDLYSCLTGKWHLADEPAQKLCGLKLPDKYSSLSLQAIAKVAPLLEQGVPFGQARRQVWPEQFTEKEPLECLPPVKDVLKEVRNPAVVRALTELRKTVNCILRRYGKPASIHIELARDMKRTREERKRESSRNRKREQERARAKEELRPFVGDNPSRWEVDKYLLWKECGGRCPYTGEMISLQSLFGAHPRFDIEHIVPFDRSLDDSFQNKTLCEAAANSMKGKRTPWEAFGHTDDWPQMVERVRQFGNTAKLRRFTMTETDADKLLQEFTERQLNVSVRATHLVPRGIWC